MRCPICKKDAVAKGNPFRPFCSERCKLIDLDNWLSERYRISGSVEAGRQNEARAPIPRSGTTDPARRDTNGECD
ncbi:MAG: DNA gyrase inhibitor YacG [Terriglobia bacterium]